MTIAGSVQDSQIGGYLRMNDFRPGFWSPIALSIPPGVSAIRGIGLPERGSGVMPLEMNAPSFWMSIVPWYSWP